MRKWPLGAFLLVILITRCANKQELVSSETHNPKESFLSFAYPEVFQIEADAEGEYQLALEVTYSSSELTPTMEALPLYYILEGPGLGNGLDKKFSLKVKNSDGEWRGKEGKLGYQLEEKIGKPMVLSAGKYSLKLYADSGEKAPPIYGIEELTLKLYRSES